MEKIRDLHRRVKETPKQVGEEFEEIIEGLFRHHGEEIFRAPVQYLEVNTPKNRALAERLMGIKLMGPAFNTRGIDGVIKVGQEWILVQIKLCNSGIPDIKSFLDEMTRTGLRGFLITTSESNFKYFTHENSSMVVFNQSFVQKWLEQYGWEFKPLITEIQEPELRLPRFDQAQIYRECLKHLDSQRWCLLNLAPGYGKTLLSIWIAQNYRRVLVVAPIIALVAQHLKEWYLDTDEPYQMVCSRTPISPVATTASEDILGFHLKQDRTTFVTYDSLELLQEMEFDLVVFDECHTFGGDWEKTFPGTRKLFVSATIETQLSIPIVQRTLMDAISKKVLSDFQYVFPLVHEGDLEREDMAKAVLQSFQNFGCLKMMGFTSRHEHAAQFQTLLTRLSQEQGLNLTVLRDSEKNDRDIIEEFRRCETPCLMLSVRKYIQGLDVPRCDSICVLFQCSSLQSWIQMIGRALRKDPKNLDKVAKVIIPVSIDETSQNLDEIQSSNYSKVVEVLQSIEDDSAQFWKRSHLLKASSAGIYQDLDPEEFEQIQKQVEVRLIDSTQPEYYQNRQRLKLLQLQSKQEYQAICEQENLPKNPERYYDGQGKRGKWKSWKDYLSLGNTLTKDQVKKLFREYLKSKGHRWTDFQEYFSKKQTRLYLAFIRETPGTDDISLDHLRN